MNRVATLDRIAQAVAEERHARAEAIRMADYQCIARPALGRDIQSIRASDVLTILDTLGLLTFEEAAPREPRPAGTLHHTVRTEADWPQPQSAVVSEATMVAALRWAGYKLYKDGREVT